MASHLDEEMLRLNEDYPDQRHWVAQQTSNSAMDYGLPQNPHSVSGAGFAFIPPQTTTESAQSVRRRSSKGLPRFLFAGPLLSHMLINCSICLIYNSMRQLPESQVQMRTWRARRRRMQKLRVTGSRLVCCIPLLRLRTDSLD